MFHFPELTLTLTDGWTHLVIGELMCWILLSMDVLVSNQRIVDRTLILSWIGQLNFRVFWMSVPLLRFVEQYLWHWLFSLCSYLSLVFNLCFAAVSFFSFVCHFPFLLCWCPNKLRSVTDLWLPNAPMWKWVELKRIDAHDINEFLPKCGGC